MLVSRSPKHLSQKSNDFVYTHNIYILTHTHTHTIYARVIFYVDINVSERTSCERHAWMDCDVDHFTHLLHEKCIYYINIK